MIKVRYLHHDGRVLKDCPVHVEVKASPYLTRTEAVVLKMQLEEVIKKIDGERKNT